MNGINVVSLKNFELINRLEIMHENYISDFILFENTLVSCGHDDTEIKIWNTKTLTLEKILSEKNTIFTKLAISDD
jgi:hypothetical protein